MTSFLALYRGETVGAAKMVAVSADPSLVSDFAARLLGQLSEPEEDPVIASIEGGRHRALRVIANEGNRKAPKLLAERTGQGTDMR